MTEKPRQFNRAPVRYKGGTEGEKAEGRSSTQYGVIRRLAHEERRQGDTPYLRLLLDGVGKGSEPWGGLVLEVNGEIFQFSAGIRQYPNYHHERKLTEEGEEAMASGIKPGMLRATANGVWDWRWVHDEVDVTSLMTPEQISSVAEHFQGLRDGLVEMPAFQSRTWAAKKGYDIKPGQHNCTTIILGQMRDASVVGVIDTYLPVVGVNALKSFVDNNPRVTDVLDYDLNELLALDEPTIQTRLDVLAAQQRATVDWSGVAKGIEPIPTWLTLDRMKL